MSFKKPQITKREREKLEDRNKISIDETFHMFTSYISGKIRD